MPFVRVLCFSSVRPSCSTHIFFPFSFFLPSWLLLTLLVEFSHLFPPFLFKIPSFGFAWKRTCRTQELITKSNFLLWLLTSWAETFIRCRQTHLLKQWRSQNSFHPVSKNFITLRHPAGWPTCPPPHSHPHLAGLFSKVFENTAVRNVPKAKWCMLKPVWTGKTRRLLFNTWWTNEWRSGSTEDCKWAVLRESNFKKKVSSGQTEALLSVQFLFS